MSKLRLFNVSSKSVHVRRMRYSSVGVKVNGSVVGLMLRSSREELSDEDGEDEEAIGGFHVMDNDCIASCLCVKT